MLPRSPSLSASVQVGARAAPVPARAPNRKLAPSATSAVNAEHGSIQMNLVGPRELTGDFRDERGVEDLATSQSERSLRAAASSTLSVSSCRATRPRVAPSAVRIASSRRRALARASSRLATLAHAMRSTNPTAPSSTRSGVRTSPVRFSRSETALMPRSLSSVGYSRARAAAMPSSSACACFSDVPALSRRDHAHAHSDAAVPEQRFAPLADRHNDRRAPPDHVVARHDADDRVEPFVQGEAAAQHVRIAAEARPPEVRREHDNRRAAPAVFVDAKGAADDRLHVQRGENLCRSHLTAKPLGCRLSGEVERVAAVRGHESERAAPLAANRESSGTKPMPRGTAACSCRAAAGARAGCMAAAGAGRRSRC